MFLRFVLAVAPVIVLAAACGGGETDGLQTIQRLELDGKEVTAADTYNPDLAQGYPSVLVTVNGVAISAQELVGRQVEVEIFKRQLLGAGAQINDPSLIEISGVNSLEQLVDRELLGQAGMRLGYTVGTERAAEVAAMREAIVEESAAGYEALLAHARVQGWPEEGWAESDMVISDLKRDAAILAVQQEECGPPVSDPSRSQIINDCTDFLAAERENADIEYFVVWAE